MRPTPRKLSQGLHRPGPAAKVLRILLLRPVRQLPESVVHTNRLALLPALPAATPSRNTRRRRSIAMSRRGRTEARSNRDDQLLPVVGAARRRRPPPTAAAPDLSAHTRHSGRRVDSYRGGSELAEPEPDDVPDLRASSASPTLSHVGPSATRPSALRRTPRHRSFSRVRGLVDPRDRCDSRRDLHRGVATSSVQHLSTGGASAGAREVATSTSDWHAAEPRCAVKHILRASSARRAHRPGRRRTRSRSSAPRRGRASSESRPARFRRVRPAGPRPRRRRRHERTGA